MKTSPSFFSRTAADGVQDGGRAHLLDGPAVAPGSKLTVEWEKDRHDATRCNRLFFRILDRFLSLLSPARNVQHPLEIQD